MARPHLHATASNLAAIAVAMLLTSACVARTATACGGRVFLEDKPSPAATGRDLRTGESIDLDRMRGRPVVVNFWGSWCAPCRAESPVLASAWEELSPTVAFLGIDIRDEKAPAEAFVDEFNLGYPHIFDREATIAAAWGVSSPPATFVVSSDGELKTRLVGVLTRQDLDCMLDIATR
jgi:thiol-disulfide isomerase/thioredoxin